MDSLSWCFRGKIKIGALLSHTGWSLSWLCGQVWGDWRAQRQGNELSWWHHKAAVCKEVKGAVAGPTRESTASPNGSHMPIQATQWAARCPGSASIQSDP